MIKLWKRIKFVFNVRKSIPFLNQFFRSKEVSREKKWTSVLLLVLYLIFPWDLIPDVLVFFGIIDDLAVFTFVLQLMVKMAPESLKEQYELKDQ
ncbi:DUF1232 domain-containing protein [Halobacillus locisalis]|uniref:DUF1232 domain-containing protein n=1 Tax=Halobacillus locisalis TaxID=220753 RepID=A0A838CXU6_9BACI|nr:DUF1232 domain-containing protein [Halobacillus locisalis]MBA2176748.1 DUF1232 domain-containing protein [Halobacillus locisalis]